MRKDKTPCETNNTSTLSITNSFSNPYTINIDGTGKGNITGNGSQTYDITVGAHRIKATQVSGYLVYPTIKTGSITITQCQTSDYSIP